MALLIILRERVSRPLSNFNCKCTVHGAVNNDDLALWWCQQLLQVQFTFVYKEILEVEII